VCAFGLFGHVYITTGCFDRSIKTLDDVNIPWEFINLADFVARNFTRFQWVVGYSASF